MKRLIALLLALILALGGLVIAIADEQPEENLAGIPEEVLKEDAVNEEDPDEQPAEEPAGVPEAEPAEEPAEEPKEESAEEPAEESAEKLADKPDEEPAEEPVQTRPSHECGRRGGRHTVHGERLCDPPQGDLR